MMRIIVTPGDRTIIVDGEAHVCEFSCNPGTLAIRWLGSHGQIDVDGRRSAAFTDFGIVAPYVAKWRAARAAAKTAERERLETIIAEHEALVASQDTCLRSLDDQANLMTKEYNDALAAGDDRASQISITLAVVVNHKNQMESGVDALNRSLATLRDNLTIAREIERQAIAEAS